MAKASPTYRLAALALVLSFTLGAALPASCHQGAAMGPSDAKHHSGTMPCAGPCHATKAPVETAPALLPPADRHLTGFVSAPLAALSAPAVAPTEERRLAAFARRCGQSASGLPVRLHVYHAVFLN